MKKSGNIRKIVNSLCTLMCIITVFTALAFYTDEAPSESAAQTPVQKQTEEIKKYTVVVDAGHGGKDGGAEGENGTVEAELNLAVAKALQGVLEARGMEVIMTRENSEALGSTKSADMEKRRQIMNTDGASAVVSIHMNKFNCKSRI